MATDADAKFRAAVFRIAAEIYDAEFNAEYDRLSERLRVNLMAQLSGALAAVPSAPPALPRTKRIVAILRHAPRPLSAPAIAMLLGEPLKTVRATLYQMASRAGNVTHDSGVWSLGQFNATTSDPEPAP